MVDGLAVELEDDFGNASGADQDVVRCVPTLLLVLGFGRLLKVPVKIG